MRIQTGNARMRRLVLTMSLGIALFLQTGAEAFSFGTPVLGDTPLQNNENIALGMPHKRHGDANEIIISRSQYVLSWNPELRVPNWVAWKLDMNDFGEARKRSSFRIDPDLKWYLAGSDVEPVRADDYKATCFDRGHQVPAADRTASDADNASTFFMSNIIPQTSWLNRLQWRHGENFERRLVRTEGKTVYLIAGGIYSSNIRRIGPNGGVAVPDASFKILVALDHDADGGTHFTNMMPLVAVKIPNVNSDGSDPFVDHELTCLEGRSGYKLKDISDDHLEPFRTSLAEIEELTGFEFFGHDPSAPMSQKPDSRPFSSFWQTALPLAPAR